MIALKVSASMYHLLIADKNPIFRVMMKKIFTSSLIDVVVDDAASAKEALEMTRKKPVHLVLIDMTLPVTQGENIFVLIEMLKKLNPCVKVVAMSAEDKMEYRDAACKSGADWFISKNSVTLKEVEAIITSILSEQVCGDKTMYKSGTS